MNYKKIFNPSPLLQDFRDDNERKILGSGDRRDGKVYLYTERIVLAVNVAIATGRPLLVQGSSGCGKSSLAYNVSRVMKRRYYEYVVNSRTQARDLLWRYDAVRRLGDAQTHVQAGKNRRPGSSLWDSYHAYVEPGILWWAFDRQSASSKGRATENPKESIHRPLDPVVYEPDSEDDQQMPDAGVVILIDEIDKAEPDFPNNLLVPLGSLEFTVDEIQKKVKFQRQSGGKQSFTGSPLVVITTNRERRLPQAFLRRCVILEIDDPKPKDLVEIARATEGNGNLHLYNLVAVAMERLAQNIESEYPSQKSLSIAEYLDAVRACIRLQKRLDPELLESIVEMTTWKEREKK